MSLVARIVVTVVCALLFAQAQPRCATAASQYACENYVSFVSPGQPEAAQYAAYQPLPWSDWQKRKIDYTLGLVHSLAPGLLANACAGRKLAFINCGRNDKVYAQSYLTEMYIFPRFWDLASRTTQWEVADMLAHEITHMVDNGNNLSRGAEWYALTADRILACRTELSTLKSKTGATAISKDAIAKQYGLPSAYALKGPPESLAECVSANLFSKTFVVPSDLSEYIQTRVLLEQPRSEYNNLMHAGWENELMGQYNRALDDYKLATKIEPKSVRARQGLCNCLLHLRKMDEAATELKMLENILSREYALSEDHSELAGVRQQLSALKNYAAKPPNGGKRPGITPVTNHGSR